MPSCPCGSESTHRRSMRRLNATHWYKNRPSKCSPLSDRAFKHLCLAPFRTVDPLFVFLLRLAGLHPPRIQLRRLEERRPVQLSSNHPHRLVRHQLSSRPRQHPLRREHDVPNCTREKDERCKAKRLHILKDWSWPRKLSSTSGHSSVFAKKLVSVLPQNLTKDQHQPEIICHMSVRREERRFSSGFWRLTSVFAPLVFFPHRWETQRDHHSASGKRGIYSRRGAASA